MTVDIMTDMTTLLQVTVYRTEIKSSVIYALYVASDGVVVYDVD
jgi:hypothetical protein